MEYLSNARDATGGAAGANWVQQIREDWRLAREAHKELQTVGARHTNLLLVGTGGAIDIVLQLLELREPVLSWRPGQALELPSPDWAATLVLHDVSLLTHESQLELLRWLDETAGRVRIVSTTSAPLWPRVKMGAFHEVLYYRVNTVCVDVAV